MQGCRWNTEVAISTFITRGQAGETNGSVPSKTEKEPHIARTEEECRHQVLNTTDSRVVEDFLAYTDTLNCNRNFVAFL